MVVACCCPILHISQLPPLIVLSVVYLFLVSVDCGTLFILSYNSVENSSIRSMILSWLWISLPCLCRSVTSLFRPIVSCILLTFLRLFDAMIVSRIISWLHTLFVIYRRRFPQFLVASSSGLVFVTISSISVAFWLS